MAVRPGGASDVWSVLEDLAGWSIPVAVVAHVALSVLLVRRAAFPSVFMAGLGVGVPLSFTMLYQHECWPAYNPSLNPHPKPTLVLLWGMNAGNPFLNPHPKWTLVFIWGRIRAEVFVWGRGEYGRLGLGDRSGSSKLRATHVKAMEGHSVVQVASLLRGRRV